MLEKKIAALKNMSKEELVGEFEKLCCIIRSTWKLAWVNLVSMKKQLRRKFSAA